MFGRRKLLKFGNYNLDGKSLGEGSFGKVEKATHTKVKTTVALKFVERKNIKDGYESKYLTREAQLLLDLKHANIARIIEVVTSRELYCLCIGNPNKNVFFFRPPSSASINWL